MRVDERLKRIEIVMGKFTEAIQVYAQHLESHTGAIISLSEAAQDLKRGVAEQNKVLSELAKAVEEMNAHKEREVMPIENDFAEAARPAIHPAHG